MAFNPDQTKCNPPRPDDLSSLSDFGSSSSSSSSSKSGAKSSGPPTPKFACLDIVEADGVEAEFSDPTTLVPIDGQLVRDVEEAQAAAARKRTLAARKDAIQRVSDVSRQLGEHTKNSELEPVINELSDDINALEDEKDVLVNKNDALESLLVKEQRKTANFAKRTNTTSDIRKEVCANNSDMRLQQSDLKTNTDKLTAANATRCLDLANDESLWALVVAGADAEQQLIALHGTRSAAAEKRAVLCADVHEAELNLAVAEQANLMLHCRLEDRNFSSFGTSVSPMTLVGKLNHHKLLTKSMRAAHVRALASTVGMMLQGGAIVTDGAGYKLIMFTPPSMCFESKHFTATTLKETGSAESPVVYITTKRHSAASLLETYFGISSPSQETHVAPGLIADMLNTCQTEDQLALVTAFRTQNNTIDSSRATYTTAKHARDENTDEELADVLTVAAESAHKKYRVCRRKAVPFLAPEAAGSCVPYTCATVQGRLTAVPVDWSATPMDQSDQ